MEIRSKKELDFYIMADRIMAGRPARRTMLEAILSFLGLATVKNGGVIDFQRVMRKYSYYKSTSNKNIINKLYNFYYKIIFAKLSEKLNFSIGPDVFGYGLLIPHHGTIVVNGNVRCGNYCVLHTSTCIAGGNKNIGDGLYLSTGSIITGDISIGDNVSVSANSLVNKSFQDNVLLVGTLASIKKTNYKPWYKRDGERFAQRVLKIEKLKEDMGI